MKIAVIPARGGSKRIPRKNIKLFHGKPMIAYAIDVARTSNIFDHIVVTTDDKEIAEIAKSCGAEIPFMRPSNISDDITPTVPVISHAIKSCQEIGWFPSEVCCIYPGVPFLSASDLRKGYEILKHNRKGYTFAVTTFPSAIQRAFRRQADGSVQPFHPEFAATRTQDLEPGYFDVGQFYWGNTKSWIEELNIHLNGHTLIVPEWKVVDIDTHADWERAEILYSALNNHGLI
jgi:pseudaminic acid cytidylyltransferase